MDQPPVPPSKKQRGGIASYIPGIYRDNSQLELTSKPADESTFNRAIKHNATLDAVRAKLATQKAKADEANERLQRDNEALETQATVLKDAITKLRDELEESERIRDALVEEVRQFQAQEYERTRGAVRESHEVISSQFREIFRQCLDWARDYFKIKIVDFDIRKFPKFKEELEKVSWGNSDWNSKQLFKVSHLVQAVLGNMICDQIFVSLFSGTPQDFHRQFQDMYEIKYRNDRAEAQRWRATSLQIFYSCKRWPLRGQESHSLRTYKQRHATDILRSIDEVLRPIITTHCPNLSDEEMDVQRERLLRIAKYAKALSEKMGQQSSELQILSKSWFSKNGRLLIPGDPRMESRLGEDHSPQENLRVDLILSPGFLKYGNDNAENIDVWNVWIPAIVETHDPARPPPPPLSRPPPTGPARTPPVFASGDPELPGDRWEQEAASPGATTEQEPSEDEEYVNADVFTVHGVPWY